MQRVINPVGEPGERKYTFRDVLRFDPSATVCGIVSDGLTPPLRVPYRPWAHALVTTATPEHPAFPAQ
jgi:hypothetical protein